MNLLYRGAVIAIPHLKAFCFEIKNKRGLQMKKNQIIQALVMGLFLQSCSDDLKQIGAVKGNSSGKQIVLDEASWKTEKEMVSGSVTVLSKVLTTEGRVKAEESMKETSLESLNLPSNLNANAFTMKSRGNVRTKQAVYLAPKLYFYTTAQGAEVKPQKFGDKVVIPLHAILVDGLSDTVPKPDGIETVALPASYKINIESIKTELIKRGYDQDTSVGPLDGCAKSFTISVFGTTYDVTPDVVAQSNYCEINRPFTLNLVVPASKADLIINEALYMNEIDASASFEVMAGYVDADTRIQLDRSKIYEKLQASLQAQYPPYATANLQLKLKNIIQSETMNIFIKGDRTDIINQLVQAAYDSFVTPYELKAGADSEATDCSDKYSCLDINYEKNKEVRELEVSYQQYSTTMTGRRISTFAKPQQILFPEVGFTSVDNQNENYISNLSQNRNDRPLLVSVNSGAVLEVILNNTVSQIDNTVLNYSASRSDRCASREFGTNRCEWHETYLDVNRSYAGISFTQPVAVAGNVLGRPDSELFFKFTRNDGSAVECSFSELNASSKGTKYIVRIKNTEGCRIFKNKTGNEINNEEQVNVRIINRLKDSVKLKQINDGKSFNLSNHYVGKDNPAQGDETLMGGSVPLAITSAEREIKLDIKVLVRKYDLLKVE